MNRTINISDGSMTLPYRNYVDYCVGSKQAKPVTVPLPYIRKVSSAAWQGNVFWNIIKPAADTTIAMCDEGVFTYQLNCAYNKAYERIKDELLSSAQLGASLAQMNQSCEMIHSRATQMLQMARAIKSGNFRGLRNRASNVPRPNGSRPQTLGDAWLEYHFGWAPMIHDVYEASEVLVRPVKTLWSKSGAIEPLPRVHLGNNGHPFYVNGKAMVRCSAGLSVTNPNVMLANGLGLLNPVSIAWELVPFSFVVDWFTSMGTVLASMTDFLGADLVGATTTRCIKFRWDYAKTAPYPPGYVGSYYARSNGNTMWMKRENGLSGPFLLVKPPKILSLTRAATSVALLSGFLKKNA